LRVQISHPPPKLEKVDAIVYNETMPTRTKESIQEAVVKSTSIAGTIRSLGLVVAGGNYNSIKGLIEKYDIDTSHFTGQQWNKGQNFGPKRPIEDYLNNTYPIKSYKLKERLYKEGLKAESCEVCGISEWQGKRIVLELDHIDGNHFNNMLSNLKILCPNCHSQTDTYRFKKRNS
jgi:hypothetical protein